MIHRPRLVDASERVTLAPPTLLRIPGALLRPWSVDDADAYGRTIRRNEAHLRRFTPWVVDGRVPGVPYRHRLADFAAAFAAGREWVYGIFADPAPAPADDADGLVLGSAGLYPRVGPGAIEIGAWLAASASGRGLATRVAIALTDAAFASDAIERVEMRCDPANTASNRVPAKLGFGILHSPPVRARGVTVWAIGRTAWRESAARLAAARTDPTGTASP